MEMTILDHTLAAAVFLAQPTYVTTVYPAVRRILERGDENARSREYRASIALQWLVAASVLAAWFARGRPAETLGLTTPRTGAFLIALGAAVAATIFLGWQLSLVARSAEQRAAVAHQMQAIGVSALMPRTAREVRLFTGLGLSAGICEEIVWRGFLTWYLETTAGLGSWVVGGVSGALFGLAHAYQGPVGILKTGLAGALLAALFQASGSLLPAMILHTAVDLQGGMMGYIVGGDRGQAAPSEAGPA